MKAGDFFVTSKERHNHITIELRNVKTSSVKKVYNFSGKIIVPPSVSGTNVFFTYKNGVVTKSVNIDVKSNKKTEKVIN